MSQTIPNKVFRAIGDGASITRMAVSFKPLFNMTLRYWSFVGQRQVNSAFMYASSLNEVNVIEWQIVMDSGSVKPGDNVLASGSFDWRYTTSWKVWRPIKFTVTLGSPLQLEANETYWFVLKMPEDEQAAYYPLGWATTYVAGEEGEVDDEVFCSAYVVGEESSAWSAGDNSYNLVLEIFDAQAGSVWHTVIDGEGYMQPDKMRGYRCEQATSGLAATRGGQEEYSQLRYPYSNLPQKSWTSGSGQLEMDDPNAFLYAACVDTTVEHQAILGPALHLTGVKADNPEYVPNKVVARHLVDPENSTVLEPVIYYAQKFTAPADDMTATSVGVRINRMPYQRLHKLYVALYTDKDGSPNTIMGDWVELPRTYKWHWQEGTVNQVLTKEVDYWVVLKTTQDWGALPEYRVMFDQDGSAPGGKAKYSSDGKTWTSLAQSMVFRINYGAAGALNGDVVAIRYGVVAETNTLFAAAGKKVYKWVENDRVWEDISTGIEGEGKNQTTNTIKDIICFNDMLFVAQGALGNARYWNGTTWADAGYTAHLFHIGRGYLWVCDTYNTVKHTNDGTTMSAAISVGEDMFDINAFANYQGRLLVGKENGIWEIDESDLALEYLRFDGHAHQDNCIGMTVWSGMLFIPVQHSIWRWQGAQYKEVGPTDKRSGQTSAWPNRIRAMVASAPLLWAVAENDVTPGWGGLMAYNGMGWHHMTISTRQDRKCRAICMTTEVGSGQQVRVWFGEGDRISYIRLPNFTNNRYDWTDADYEITASTLHCSWWDGGVKDALKFWNRMTLMADIPEGTSIEVYASRDGAEFESASDILFLGEVVPSMLVENGEYVLMFPDGMVAKSIQPIFILNTNDSTKTPRLRAFNVEAIVRQIPVYTYTFRILLANNITRMDGTTETERTANDMWEGLQRAAAKNEPIVFSFPDKSFRGMISYLSEETYQYATDGMGQEKWERVAVVSVVEAT